MRIPYLIQSAKIKDGNCFASGRIGDMLQLDYMGSAEFEYGALPESVERTYEKKRTRDMRVYPVELDNKVIINLICLLEEKEEYSEWIREMSKGFDGKIHLKEVIGLPRLIGKQHFNDKKDEFWWDIVNDVFFTTASEVICIDFLHALCNTYKHNKRVK